MLITTTDIIAIAQELKLYKNDKTAILFVAEHTEIDINLLIKELNQEGIQFIGGIFPKIIHQDQLFDQGIAVNWVEHVNTTFVIHDLDQKQFTIPEIVLDKKETYCAFTLVDGLTGNIAYYLSELYRTLGNDCTYLGGGAGSLTLQQKPCVFDNNGFYMNAAITLIYATKLNIGVKHGWKKVTGPLIATKTDKNIVQEINWRNAFEVYKEIVEEDGSQEIREDNFFDIAKSYPFGIVKENSECVVRDPIATNEKGELVCVGEVTSNTVLDILKGEEANLIQSAKDAALLALEESSKPHTAVIIDCISRVLFLEDHFQKELNGVIEQLKNKNDQMQISGALTLGEISSFNGYLEFFNKTIVVGLFD